MEKEVSGHSKRLGKLFGALCIVAIVLCVQHLLKLRDRMKATHSEEIGWETEEDHVDMSFDMEIPLEQGWVLISTFTVRSNLIFNITHVCFHDEALAGEEDLPDVPAGTDNLPTSVQETMKLLKRLGFPEIQDSQKIESTITKVVGALIKRMGKIEAMKKSLQEGDQSSALTTKILGSIEQNHAVV